MKINKEKILTKANEVLVSFNTVKEAVNLILVGAGINEYGAKLIEQKFNSTHEGINNFLNLVMEELRKLEPQPEKLI